MEEWRTRWLWGEEEEQATERMEERRTRWLWGEEEEQLSLLREAPAPATTTRPLRREGYRATRSRERILPRRSRISRPPSLTSCSSSQTVSRNVSSPIWFWNLSLTRLWTISFPPSTTARSRRRTTGRASRMISMRRRKQFRRTLKRLSRRR